MYKLSFLDRLRILKDIFFVVFRSGDKIVSELDIWLESIELMNDKKFMRRVETIKKRMNKKV